MAAIHFLPRSNISEKADSGKSIPATIKRAAAKFKKERAAYYDFLAAMLEASKGETKILTLFERDADRYPNLPRGKLAGHWAELYVGNGGNLADAMMGTLPDDELTILRVAQDAGPGALETGLRDVARIAALADKVRKEVTATMLAAIGGLVISTLMLTIYPVFAASKITQIFSAIPVSAWGKKGQAFKGWADGVILYGPYVLAVVALMASWLYWSFANLVGSKREYLDTHNIFYKTMRDLKGAMFLSTMTTLTRRRGNVMFTLGESLATMAAGATTPWLKWRIEQIGSRVEDSGAVGAEVFQTNLLSQEMFYFLRDMQEARGMADGFQETGKYVEQSVVQSIVTRMQIYRWMLLSVGLVCMLGVVAWQFSVIDEMRGAMLNWYSSK